MMAEFLITAPDGKKYRVTGDNAQGAHAALVKSLGGASAERPPAERPQQRGVIGQVADFITGNGDSAGAQMGRSTADWLNRAGESMTFGLVGDEAAAAADAAIGRGTYDDLLAQYRQGEENLGTWGRLTADLAGALVPGAGVAGAMARAASVPAKVGIGAASGAVAGGVQGFMEGEGGFDNRIGNAGIGAGIGGVVGAAIPAAGAGVRRVMQNRAIDRAVKQATESAPTTDQLKAAGRAAYQAVDDAGVQIKPEAFDRFRAEALDTLRNYTGYDELPGAGVTPRTARVMQTMDEAASRMASEETAALPFRSLDQARRRAGAAARDFTNSTEQQAGTTLINEIDNFVQRLGPDDVVGGDPEVLKSAIGKARDLWAQGRRSELIDDAIAQSENYVSGGASGVRNQIATILRSKKLSSGFSEEEKRVLQRVINGGFLEQLVHFGGSRIGQGLTTALTAGAGAAGGPLGSAAGAAIGMGAAGLTRRASNALAMREIEQARAAIASGFFRDGTKINALAQIGARPEAATNAMAFGALNALTGPFVGR